MDRNILPVLAKPVASFSVYQKGSPYYDGLVEVCKNYHLKITSVDLETILSSPVEMFDPLVLEVGDIHLFNHLHAVLAPRRIIFAHDIGESVLYMPRVSIVAADTAVSTEMMVRYMHSMGRKKIALFAIKTTHFDSIMMQEVYKGICQRCGFMYSDDDVFWDGGSLQACTAQFIEKCEEYNGVICTNIQSAVFLIAELKRKSIRVPEDLYVTAAGYQGMPLGKYCNGGITRVEFDGKLIGKEIANTFITLKKKPHVMAAHCLMRSKLVIGGNTNVEFKDSDTFMAKKAGATPPVMTNDVFYNDANALERMMRDCDELDIKILQLIRQNESIMDIADTLFMSRRTVSYRLSRMLENSKTKTREELFQKMDFLGVTL